MKDKKILTNSEFQIMHHLWNLPHQSGYAGDILKCYEEPKPAYTTIATFLKILVQKGFIKSTKKDGKIFYTPRITRAQYAEIALGEIKTYYFEDSKMDMLLFFVRQSNLSQEEKEQLIQSIQNA
ncbi:MAG: BlaI/MecI/CopY family transcriptional regulator [Bacteroidales bacterium]|nr:BlaI/MecI/CopY family transcriptional regulator [Bacteroidales bacterium]